MQSRELKTIARPARFGRKSIGKVPSSDFLVSAALLGAVVLLSAPLEAAPEQTETPSVQAPAAVAAAQAAG